MSKEITVEELAADLASHVAEVKQGETLTIVEDGKAIATIAPALTFVHRGVPYPFRGFDPGPPLNLGDKAVEMLIEERERERSGKKHGF